MLASYFFVLSLPGKGALLNRILLFVLELIHVVDVLLVRLEGFKVLLVECSSLRLPQDSRGSLSKEVRHIVSCIHVNRLVSRMRCSFEVRQLL